MSIYHVGYVSQESVYCHMFPLHERHVLLEITGIYSHYEATQL